MNTSAPWNRRQFLCALPAAGCSALVQRGGAGLQRRFENQGLTLHRTTLAGAELEYWSGGSGAPLVFLHGFGPPAHWQWSGQVEDFAGHHRLIVPNLLWFGDSIDHEPAFTLDRQAEVLSALLEHLEVQHPTIVGISYGGFVAYRLAQLTPERVASLVLVASPVGVYGRHDYAQLLARHHVEDAVELFIPDDGDDVERLIDLVYWRKRHVPDALDEAAAAVLYADHREERAALLRNLVGSMEASQGGDVPRLPTLVVWGEHDTVFPLPLGRKLAAKLQAELFVIPKARHGPNIEHTAVFNRILRAWIERAPA